MLTSTKIVFAKDVSGKRLMPTLSALDLFDGESTEQILECREPDGLKKRFKMFGGDTNMAIFDLDGEPVGGISRNSSAFKLGKIYFHGADGKIIGTLRKKPVAVNTTYQLVNEEKDVLHEFGVSSGLNKYKVKHNGQPGCTIRTKWKGENKKFYKKNKCKECIEFEESQNGDRNVLLMFGLIFPFIDK